MKTLSSFHSQDRRYLGRVVVSPRRILAILTIGLLVALSLVPAVYAQTVGGSPPGPSGGMSAEAIMTVTAAVVALTQLVKWMGLPDKMGPFAVLGLAALGVLAWAYSVGTFTRADTFNYLSGWITVATSSAGVFGFTRAAATAVASAKPPPAGAAQNPTTP